MEELDLFELDNFEDIYKYCNLYLKDYYRDRIYELYSIVMQDEEDQNFCWKSLKCLIYFVKTCNLLLENPSVTVGESGLFYLKCLIKQKSYNIKFKCSGKVDYVLDRKQYTTTLYNLLDELNKFDFVG